MSTLKPFKITIIRQYFSGAIGKEEIAQTITEYFQDEAQARYRAIEAAARIFLLMKDIHRYKGFSGVRWTIEEQPKNQSYFGRVLEV